MSVETSVETPKKSRRQVSIPGFIPLLAVCLILWLLTRAHFMADTNVYADAILRHQHGQDPRDFRLITGNPFWDFGHLLWRPLGWIGFALARPLTVFARYPGERSGVILALLAINLLTAVAGMFFFFRLSSRISGNPWPAFVSTLGLFTTDTFLNYAHSGTAYVPGLTCVIAGMYFCSVSSEDGRPCASTAAGIAYALAVLFWFPYVFVLPAAFVTPFVIRECSRQSLQNMLRAIATCAVSGIVVYTVAVLFLGIRDFGSLKAWITAAGHGQVQPGGMRAIARLAFSLPRSFINMGRDGMWLKRYLVHDPYAPASIGTLVRLSLWKLALFYAWTGWLVIELLRTRQGQKLLLWLALAVAPVFIFALFIFEAGSIERYLPLYPFVFIALAYVLAGKHAVSKLALSGLVGVIAVVNIHAMLWQRVESQKTTTIARIHDVLPSLGPNVLLIAVNEQDDLAEFRQNFPLDPINLNRNWQTYDLVEINSERVVTWRSDFARRALTIWKRGGEVWVPTRVFRAKPEPQWNWVEGDDQRVKWTDLPAFFARFDSDPISGGDGFVRLANDSSNVRILETALREQP
jgi:Dolichyl-phosphate-mannose-protein mannosyltransferase